MIKKKEFSNIIFVIPLLKGIGGIQSSLLNLLDEISNENNNVYLCVLGNNISESVQLPKNVKIISGSTLLEFSYLDFKLLKNHYSFFGKLCIIFTKLFRRIFGFEIILKLTNIFFRIEGNFDIAISYSNDIYYPKFIGGANDVVINCINSSKKIAWIHNDPVKLGFSYKQCKKSYGKFDGIVNVSYASKKIFDSIIPEYITKSFVVNNLCDPIKIITKAKVDNPFMLSVKKIITVARIENNQKRIDRIIRCCESLINEGINNFIWTIIGDGPDYKKIKNLIIEKKLNKYINLLGYKSNPYPYIYHSDFFVLLSDYESYPMVFLESLVLGIPVISSNFPSSSEIIQNGINGYIVNKSDKDIFECIKGLLINNEMLTSLKKSTLTQNYSNKEPIDQFNKLIRHVFE